MFERGKDPLTSMRIGRFTIEHLKEVHKERVGLRYARLRADKRTREYKLLLEKEKQNCIEQKEVFEELIRQGIPKEDLLDIINDVIARDEILSKALAGGKQKPRRT